MHYIITPPTAADSADENEYKCIISLEKSDFFLQRSHGVHVVEHFAGHVPLHEQHVHLREHINK